MRDDDETTPLLEVRHLSMWFRAGLDAGGRPATLAAVDDVSLDVGVGEALGIVGESGSGKSALVRSIMGILPPSARIDPSSSIRYAGREINPGHADAPATPPHIWGTEIAMVFQDPMTALNPVRTVGAQLGDGMRHHLGVSRREATARSVDLLARVGLTEPRRRLTQYPHHLSGGMRQRVMIAIALACEPRLLIADEPTTALDVTVQRQIIELLGSLCADLDMAMILISHDLGVVAHATDRVAVMYAGRLVETAPTAALFGATRHRYTEALMSSIPRATPTRRLATIDGRPPDLRTPPAGCQFHPRCPHAVAACETDVPPWTTEHDGHGYECHVPLALADGVGVRG